MHHDIVSQKVKKMYSYLVLFFADIRFVKRKSLMPHKDFKWPSIFTMKYFS